MRTSPPVYRKTPGDRRVDDRAAVSVVPVQNKDVGVDGLVINHNGGDRLLRVVEALHAQSKPLKTIVVVDNGSSDGSLERLERAFPDVDLMPLGQNLGLPRARNLGLRRCSSELVLMTDHDIYVEPDCLGYLVRAEQETRAAVVVPRIRLLPETELVQADGASIHFVGALAVRHGSRPVGELRSERSEVKAWIGGCLLIRRAVILDGGGFDERFFFYLEDLEASLRLRGQGHCFVCEPAAVAFHERAEGTPGLSFRGTGTYPVRRVRLNMRHRLLVVLTHYRFKTLLVLAPALALYEGASLGLALTRGWTGEWLGAWLWIFGRRREIREHRRALASLRRRPDRDLLSGGPLPFSAGFFRSRGSEFAGRMLSLVFGGYWRLVRPFVG